MEKKEFLPVESQEANPVSLHSIHEKMGLTRFDVRDLIYQFRHDPDARVDAPDKAVNTALEALHIEDIWSDVRSWIDAHPECKGLSETNIPALQLVIQGAHTANAKIPSNSEDIEINPLSRDSYLDIKLLTQRRFHNAESFTRNLLQAFLVKWEVSMQESLENRASSKTLRQCLYERYLAEIMIQDEAYQQFRHPATRKMFSGFSFGQSVYWRLSDTEHTSTVPKLGMTHLCIIHDVSKQTNTFTERPTKNNVLSNEVLDSMDRRIHIMKTLQRQGAEHSNSPSFDSITTGCPAFFTPAFEELGEWIRSIRSELSDHRTSEG